MKQNRNKIGLKSGDKVQVMVSGKLTEIVIWSLDSQYIYFVPPQYKGTSLNNHLERRGLSFDYIIKNGVDNSMLQ